MSSCHLRRRGAALGLALGVAATSAVAAPGHAGPPEHPKVGPSQAGASRLAAEGPRIEERRIREVLRRHRDALALDDRDRLPPGIRMNVARGKPLPPGITRRLDADILRDLPRHEGYEWRRVGWDVVLVDATRDIIHAVIRDALN